MARGVLRRTVALAVGAGIAAVFAVAFIRAPATSDSATRSAKSPAGTCVRRLLQDWRDGRIDGTYPLPCYEQTIRQLPADVRAYSSAEEDIRQARADRIVQSADRSARTPS